MLSAHSSIPIRRINATASPHVGARGGQGGGVTVLYVYNAGSFRALPKYAKAYGDLCSALPPCICLVLSLFAQILRWLAPPRRGAPLEGARKKVLSSSRNNDRAGKGCRHAVLSQDFTCFWS